MKSLPAAQPAVLVIAIITILAIGTTQGLADAGPASTFESLQQLVEALIRALNTKDASLLDKIYQVLNLNQCNSFELLVANAALRTSVYSPLLVFENLKESKAILTTPPRIVGTVSNSGSTSVVFGFRWFYVAKIDEEESSEELDLVVTWETKLFDEGWRVIGQRTSPCLPH